MSFGKRFPEIDSVPTYNPLLCKTCQKLQVRRPKRARVQFSDCEKHFQRRVHLLRLTGVTIISK
ncbi:MAG TPA: hypothetical protein VJN71_09660 [Nitrososphaerales archaeon]|nr:hypothetical protein [Nitrososphaerales archaeon]